jgi:hypothetical protein
LSPAGRARAEQLVHVLAEAKINAIYSTTTHRTIQTAQPLADFLKLQVLPYTNAQAVAEKVKRQHPGQGILIVSHSGMVEDIIEQLNGYRTACPIGGDYDNLCVVIRDDSGKTETINLHYGKPSPPSANLVDLVIESLVYRPAQPRTGNQIEFTAVVKNIGKERAYPSTLSFDIKGDTTLHSITALDAKQTSTIRRMMQINSPGNYQAKAIVDVNQTVRESNKNNNSRTASFTVSRGTPPRPCRSNEKCCEPGPSGQCYRCWPRNRPCP